MYKKLSITSAHGVKKERLMSDKKRCNSGCLNLRMIGGREQIFILMSSVIAAVIRY